MKTTCEHCLYWRPYPGDNLGEGECHRHAPAARSMNVAPETNRRGLAYRLYAWWPVTHATEDCGEFQAAAQAVSLPLVEASA